MSTYDTECIGLVTLALRYFVISMGSDILRPSVSAASLSATSPMTNGLVVLRGIGVN